MPSFWKEGGNLTIVEVSCTKVDERIHIFSKMLSNYGITSHKFNIQKKED